MTGGRAEQRAAPSTVDGAKRADQRPWKPPGREQTDCETQSSFGTKPRVFVQLQVAMTDAPKPNWHDAFPAPRITAPTITREEALPNLSSGDLLLVDVRRTDYEGGTIKGSLNLPAHSFYMNRAALFDLSKRAGVKKIAFYCGK